MVRATATQAVKAPGVRRAFLATAVATALIVGPLALPSSAATYTADSEATWRTAVADALANTGETNTITLTGDFTMSDATGIWPTYDGVIHELIVDGGGHTVTAAPGNLAGFLDAPGLFGYVTLQNITLDGFTTSSAVSIDTAAGVFLDNVVVRNFQGSNSAVALNGVTVGVYDSTFANNESLSSDGGSLGISCTSSVTILGSSFTNSDSALSGGAVYATCGMVIEDSTFSSNTANGSGGAVYSAAHAGVGGSTFIANHAGVDGGAVYSYFNGYPDTSTFTGNSAGNDGGAFYAPTGDFAAQDSTFTNNTAGNQGGGAYGYGYADSYESTWVGNEAMYGGAVYSSGALIYSLYLQSTFMDNVASASGGAVFAAGDSVETANSVFSGNEAGSVGAHIAVNTDYLQVYATVFMDATGVGGCDTFSGVSSSGYNFDDDGSCTDSWEGTGDFGGSAEDPMLGALADNGGPTHTRHPLPASPLVDAIPWAYCESTSYNTFDQRGVERYETGAFDDGCDIGAVEVIKDLTFDIVGSSGTTTVTVSGALDYDSVLWTAIDGYAPTPPAGVAFPHGVFDFRLRVPDGGWTVTVTLDLPSPVNELWKDTAGVWSQVTGANISGTSITYDITDGGALDDDGIVNSYIRDPVGAGRGAGFTG